MGTSPLNRDFTPFETSLKSLEKKLAYFGNFFANHFYVKIRFPKIHHKKNSFNYFFFQKRMSLLLLNELEDLC